MAPRRVRAVAGRAQRLARPFQALPEGARLPLERRHPPHVEEGRGEHREEQAEDQDSQAAAGAAHEGYCRRGTPRVLSLEAPVACDLTLGPSPEGEGGPYGQYVPQSSPFSF